jgi:hypothetical protein
MSKLPLLVAAAIALAAPSAASANYRPYLQTRAAIRAIKNGELTVNAHPCHRGGPLSVECVVSYEGGPEGVEPGSGNQATIRMWAVLCSGHIYTTVGGEYENGEPVPRPTCREARQARGPVTITA